MHYEIIVIGGGPGGYVAAIRAAQLGKKVALVEREELGGICLNWGCIPTKSLLRSAEVFSLIKNSQRFGINVKEFTADYPKVIQRSRQVASRLSRGVSYLMKKNGIETISGTARIVDGNSVIVQGKNGQGSQKIESDYILIATGARPRDIPGLEIDGKRVLSSREAMLLEEIPESIVIIGAGAIGVEFAYFFNTFGSQVTLVEMLLNILPLEDEEISRELEKSFKKKGISIFVGSRVDRIRQEKTDLKIFLNQKGQEETLLAERILLAVGVRGNVEGLGLEDLGIITEKGWVKVNDYYQTEVPNIYAIGDVIGAPWLAHVASAEGIIAVEHIAGKEVTPVDYKNIPGCIYCNPQVASVGLTEKKAIEMGYKVKVGRFPVRANGKALALGEIEGFVKMIYDEEYGELLGCHIIGPEATELISEITLARTVESTYHEIQRTIHPHPTLSEIIVEATGDAFGDAIHI
jgi:dihydrolipoamide dehydrogenase